MKRMLYVVGTGYTGSTLLSFLLNGHPEIATVGEATGPLKESPSYRCSCGKVLSQCEFWQAVAARMDERGFSFGPASWNLDFRLYRSRLLNQVLSQSLRHTLADSVRDRLVFSVPQWKRRLLAAGRRNDAFMDSVLQVSSKTVFLDASKDPIRMRYLLQLSAAEVRVVHLVRDAPGFVSSFVKNKGCSLELGIRYWNRMADHVKRLQEGLSSKQFLRVQYEELCRHTTHTLDRIATFAGVDPFPELIEFRHSAHHIIGNRMRMASSSEIALDEKWRERLTPRQVEEILRRTSHTRRMLSYV